MTCCPTHPSCPPITHFDTHGCEALGTVGYGFGTFNFCGDGFGSLLANAFQNLNELAKAADALNCKPIEIHWDDATHKKGSLTIGDYTIKFDVNDRTIIVHNNCTGAETKFHGDPHVDNDNNGTDDWSFKGTATFKLDDGTVLTLKTGTDGLIDEAIIVKGDQYADLKFVVDTPAIPGTPATKGHPATPDTPATYKIDLTTGEKGGEEISKSLDLGAIYHQATDGSGGVKWQAEETNTGSSGGTGSSGSGGDSGSGGGDAKSSGSGSNSTVTAAEINKLIATMENAANIALGYQTIITEITQIDKTAMSASRISAT